jgi:hypothetical protein
MAHFAELDKYNNVTQVVVVNNDELLVDGAENESKGIDFLEALFHHRRWKQTSYNSNMRGRYAGVGMRYDESTDEFVCIEQ